MLDSKTKLLGLIGHPVEHSLSPIMHNSALQYENLNYVYLAFDVSSSENLKYVIDGAKSLRIRGFNITIPYKIDVMKYLDKIDYTAELIGAVNTVKIENNIAIGYNTDGLGARMALEEEIGGVENKNILIIGAGGASRAVAFELAKNNNITIINRTLEKAKNLADEISKKLKPNNPINYGDLNIDVEKYDIIIHTTPVGMYPNTDVKPIIDTKKISKNMVVMDLIYNPEETVLLRESKKRGAKTINGLGMLVYQGAIAFEIWTGIKPNVELMKKTLKEYLRHKA
jgi:shikimate dehydrogenase